MVAAAIAIASSVILVGTVYLVYMNRGSAEVVGAAFPVMVGALAALALVFVFRKPEPLSRSFNTMILTRKVDGVPVSVRFRPEPITIQMLYAAAIKKNPTLRSGDGRFRDGGGELSHHLLQRAIIDWMTSRYPMGWRVRSESFDSGPGRIERWLPLESVSSIPPYIYKEDEIRRELAGNVFGSVDAMRLVQLAVPAGTALKVTAPHHNPQRGVVSEIRLSNRFADLRISIELLITGQGLGNYGRLAGLNQSDVLDQFWSDDYVVRITTEFPQFRYGHPDMVLYREWAESLTNGIAFAFDEKNTWNQALDTEFLIGSPRATIGPYRSPAEGQGMARPDRRE